MAPRAMKPADGVAWITGASSGIGAAAALELAARGWQVAVSARRLEALEELAARGQGLPGRIVAHRGDVTDAAAMAAIVETIEHVHGPIALAFLNAGMSPPMPRGACDADAFAQAFAVNLLGVVKALEPLMPRMAGRGRGQIAVNGSLAGYRGLPLAPAYGASKAAVIHLCESLAFSCAGQGILLQLVSPGFVATPLVSGMGAPMPFAMTPEEAARRIVDGFERGRFEIAFPHRLAWPAKAGRLLPFRLYAGLLRRLMRRGGGG